MKTVPTLDPPIHFFFKLHKRFWLDKISRHLYSKVPVNQGSVNSVPDVQSVH